MAEVPTSPLGEKDVGISFISSVSRELKRLSGRSRRIMRYLLSILYPT
jgi:hypothetical protein